MNKIQLLRLMEKSLQGNPINLPADNDIDNLKIVFQNHKNSSCKRLTDYGLVLMKMCFESFEIEIKESKISTKLLIWLKRSQTFPYHINKKILTLFDEEWSFKLKLSDGNYQVFTKNSY